MISPIWGVYNSTGGALCAPLDIPTGATLKQVDCYGYRVGANEFPHWFVMAFDNLGHRHCEASPASADWVSTTRPSRA